MEMFLRLSSRWFLVAIASILVSVSVGCSEKSDPMGMISGKVTSSGNACGNCQLEILEPNKLLSMGAMVKKDGTFELKDIPFGEYQVAVQQVLDPHDPGDPPPDDRIPDIYRDPKTSGLTFVINSTDEFVLDIEMTGKFVGKNRAKQDADDAMD